MASSLRNRGGSGSEPLQRGRSKSAGTLWRKRCKRPRGGSVLMACSEGPSGGMPGEDTGVTLVPRAGIPGISVPCPAQTSSGRGVLAPYFEKGLSK